MSTEANLKREKYILLQMIFLKSRRDKSQNGTIICSSLLDTVEDQDCFHIMTA